MPSACLVCLAHVSMRWPTCRLRPCLSVREGCAPYALRGGKLGAVPVGDVANALGGQRVADVAAFAVTLNEVPSIDEAAHHLAYPSLGDA